MSHDRSPSGSESRFAPVDVDGGRGTDPSSPGGFFQEILPTNENRRTAEAAVRSVLRTSHLLRGSDSFSVSRTSRSGRSEGRRSEPSPSLGRYGNMNRPPHDPHRPNGAGTEPQVRVANIIDRSLCFPACLYLLILSLLTRTGGPNPVGLLSVPCGGSGLLVDRAARKFGAPVWQRRCPGEGLEEELGKEDACARYWDLKTDGRPHGAGAAFEHMSALLPLSRGYCSIGVPLRLCEGPTAASDAADDGTTLRLDDGKSNCTQSPEFEKHLLVPVENYVRSRPDLCRTCRWANDTARPAVRLLLHLSGRDSSHRTSYRLLDEALRAHRLLESGASTSPSSSAVGAVVAGISNGEAFRAVYHEYPLLALAGNPYDILLPPIVHNLLMLFWAAAVGYVVCRRLKAKGPYLGVMAINAWICCWVALVMCLAKECVVYGVGAGIFAGCQLRVLCGAGREMYQKHLEEEIDLEEVHRFDEDFAASGRHQGAMPDRLSPPDDLKLYTISDDGSEGGKSNELTFSPVTEGRRGERTETQKETKPGLQPENTNFENHTTASPSAPVPSQSPVMITL